MPRLIFAFLKRGARDHVLVPLALTFGSLPCTDQPLIRIIDNNLLRELGPNGTMPRLRILRVSGNRLQGLNASPFPNLRTLYADNNSLGSIVKASRLTKLENLSLRNQGGRGGM